ncbi:cytidylyltransferase domain-containing protein [Dysgonomonas sp. 520]|uniref:acylneuraminate cytidylyltransferase family protein n=1 Tax=Dysgonomonas sp. 520 TaxID=2302931 RepID=UPI0013D0290C|nr:acylneuraminate cytidylyltransferase family protein [Dysgonomonas sp. 520]NDW08113.1 acylneuraminate cytidylyltransferase family protein [Dysgonomonas sp. 520]
MKIKALIAVRSGSERVVNKNLRPFAGSNLLELKIKQLKGIKEFDGIVVNSNDDRMLEIADSLGAEAVKRDPVFATSSVSMSDVYQNMAENFNGDVIAYCNVTNPLVNSESYSNAVRTFKEISNKFDSLNSANLVKEFMFLDNKPINYDLEHQPRSQDLPNIYALNFAISIISKENMIKYKNVIGRVPYMYELSEAESVDIDTEFDFEIAEFFYRKKYKL